MGIVLQFRSRQPIACTEITQQQHDEIQALLSEVLVACPACEGTGQFTHKHPITGTIACSPCPCGGTDEDRVDLDGPYFGGTA